MVTTTSMQCSALSDVLPAQSRASVFPGPAAPVALTAAPLHVASPAPRHATATDALPAEDSAAKPAWTVMPPHRFLGRPRSQWR